MPRTSAIIVGALNIVISPHPTGIYAAFIESVKGKAVHSRGTERALVGTLVNAAGRGLPDRYYYGQIFFYTEIELGGAWLDLVARGAATNEAVEEINIPAHLRPNMKSMRYVFDTAKHIMYFEAKNENGDIFSPQKVKRVFERLAKTESKKYPDVAITLLPQRDAIDRVLNIPHLSKLVIRLERPNPDDIGGRAREILARLEAQNASRQEIVLTKTKSADELLPDDEMVTLAEVASENGFAAGQGQTDEGQRISRRTSNYPQQHYVSIADGSDPLEALFEFIQNHNEN